MNFSKQENDLSYLKYCVLRLLPSVDLYLKKSPKRLLSDIATILSLLQIALRGHDFTEIVLAWSSLFIAVAGYEIAYCGKEASYTWRDGSLEAFFDEYIPRMLKTLNAEREKRL
ncbi:unnamed protein product [Kuraishia capsulata CBS 1993]|uniref:Uncharacterized protein n=1 Tax=Kuraishia capsulata CBS 1993 TaxID=1382522 RepID=W6MKG3_9ASCO|nr:uncharacterized protein KUCA_T00001149001 [Kuraishia capsulata CBS 1993]CDK25182.1 unnamed protein product [Kuraishia capsulata CBS 1993]